MARGGSAWNELAEEHFGRIVEPNHLERSLDVLRRLPRLDDPDAVAAYLEDDDVPELDEKAKRTLFEEWFALTYSVTSQEGDSADDVAWGEPDDEGPWEIHLIPKTDGRVREATQDAIDRYEEQVFIFTPPSNPSDPTRPTNSKDEERPNEPPDQPKKA